MSTVHYEMRSPCKECPFLVGTGYREGRLEQFASGEFPCHKASVLNEDADYVPRPDGKTPHCAGALIYNEKRNRPHQMMRICERLGFYDASKLDMNANVR